MSVIPIFVLKKGKKKSKLKPWELSGTLGKNKKQEI
jgi:hypothetical protein